MTVTIEDSEAGIDLKTVVDPRSSWAVTLP